MRLAEKLVVLGIVALAAGCAAAPDVEPVCSGEAAVRKDFPLRGDEVGDVFAGFGWVVEGASARNLTPLPAGNVTARWHATYTDVPANQTAQVVVAASARGSKAALESASFGAYWMPVFDALAQKGDDPGQWVGPEYIPGADPGPQTRLRVSCPRAP